MNALTKYKDDLEEKAEEVAEIREDILQMQSDITIGSVISLMNKLDTSIGEFLEDSVKKKYYDETLGGTIKSTIKELVSAFSKIKAPEVNVSPNISMDLSPLQASIDNMTGTTKKLSGLIEKMNNGDKSDELYRLIVAMINKQNIFTEKAVSQIDYSIPLQSISDALNKEKSEVAWKGEILERDFKDRIKTWSIKPIK